MSALMLPLHLPICSKPYVLSYLSCRGPRRARASARQPLYLSDVVYQGHIYGAEHGPIFIVPSSTAEPNQAAAGNAARRSSTISNVSPEGVSTAVLPV